MLALSEFHPFISLLIGLNWTPNQATFTSCVSWDSNGFSWGFTQCYWIFTKVAPFYWVLLGLTGCPPILLGSIVFFVGFPIVYWVSQSALIFSSIFDSIQRYLRRLSAPSLATLSLNP